MTVPGWVVAAVLIVLVILLAWAILAGFAWYGVFLELEQARAEQHLLWIDIYDARSAARRGEAKRAFGDRVALSAERDDRVLGSFEP